MFSIVTQFFIVFFSLSYCNGLYEDQIGKFEWREQYVGNSKFSYFDMQSALRKVIVATEQNVLAALNLKNGELLWRHVLESNDNGKIQTLFVGSEIVTVSGTNFPLVRGWDLENGYLLWEWVIPSHGEYSKWIVTGVSLFQLDFVRKSHISVIIYNVHGSKVLQTQMVPATWLDPESCIVQSDVIACLTSEKQIYVIKLTDGYGDLSIKVHHKSLLDLFREEVTGPLKRTNGDLPVVTINVGHVDHILVLQPEVIVVKNVTESFDLVSTAILLDKALVITTKYLIKGGLSFVTRDITTGSRLIKPLTKEISFPVVYGNPENIEIICYYIKESVPTCKAMISTSHHSLILSYFPGKVIWNREEALASIVTTEMVDLPVSDTDAAIEKEFDNRNGGFLGMFFRRLISQYLQLQNLCVYVMDLRGVSSEREQEDLIRDEFGLHKIIVAVTKPGKIYGIDNLTGKIVWQVRVDEVVPFSSATSSAVMPLYVLRTARHSPLPAKCAVLAMDKSNGNGVLILFNPITGALDDSPSRLIPLGFKVKQSLLSRYADEDFLKGIIFLDENNKIHVYPESSTKEIVKHASSTFIFAADPSGILEGFSLSPSGPLSLVGTKIWQINLGLSGDRILSIVGKNTQERVHSQGRVLGDRSVLYKYVNPNLVAVLTQGYHPSSVLNLHLIDVVTGNIIHSAVHRRVKEPVHLVHSENWVIYTYFNEKYRRTELSAIELYEGKTQSNATVFSSVDSAMLMPIVERQAYILPANVLALKETITEKGITSKHILVALANGGVLELPWMYADPRRPIAVTPEMREEGVIPYIPELPIPLEAIINHNQTIMKVRGIHTSSSGLESTCLVFIYGLDLYYTRVAPSKMFDLLKDDFDYFVISTVLLALITVSYLTKKLASRKALKQAWK